MGWGEGVIASKGVICKSSISANRRRAVQAMVQAFVGSGSGLKFETAMSREG